MPQNSITLSIWGPMSHGWPRKLKRRGEPGESVRGDGEEHGLSLTWRSSNHRLNVRILVENTKTSFYSELVLQNSTSPKDLFHIINFLLHRNPESPLPPHDCAKELANQFAHSLSIRSQLSEKNLRILLTVFQSIYQLKRVNRILTDLWRRNSLISEEEIHKHILKSSSKHCELDPIPTWLLRKCVDVLLPLITCILTSSLTSATMPDDQKFAILTSLLKKPGMDLIFPSFRLISNLSFISKLIKRVVVSQTKDHVRVNNFHDPVQSAYKEGYSTETALLRVQNNLLMAKENQEVSVLVMLNLSAASLHFWQGWNKRESTSVFLIIH